MTLPATSKAAIVTLAIEISNPASHPGSGGSVALATGDPFTLLAEEGVAPATFEHDDLLPAIDRLLKSAGVQRSQIADVAVSIGPGGFTSTRVACAAGKLIAEALGATCRGVPSALVAFADDQRPHAASGKSVAIALASKKGSAWVAILPEGIPTLEHAHAARDGRVMTADQLADAHPALVLADAHLDESIRVAMQIAGVPIHTPRFAASILARVSTLLPPIDGEHLLPIYPRQPEAVTLWQQRGRG